MDLVFVRHGEPEWVAGGKPQMDPALTERGHAQAKLAATRLAGGRPVEAIFVSSATRARQTAEPIVEATGAELHVVDDLTEIRLPDLSDWPMDRVVELFRTSRARPLAEWAGGLAGGEPFDAFAARVTKALRALLEGRGVRLPQGGGHPVGLETKGRSERVVIVAHGGTNAVGVGHLLGIPPTPWEWHRLSMAHAALSRLRAIELGEAHVFSLRSLNDVEHLPRELRTA